MTAEFEQQLCTNDDGGDDKNTLIEYKLFVDSLMRDLDICKGEQIRLRMELETIGKESKKAAEIARESFSHSNKERCIGNENYQESVENLEKQISIMEKEKESVFKLWQISLKAVETLEQELKTTKKDALKYYQDQVEQVKETYSEAIKALEGKLLQAKENFLKHQSLWESSREKIESLSKEKKEIERKLVNFENEARSKDDANGKEIVGLRTELEASRTELEKMRRVKIELEEKILRLVAKDEESKGKIFEAIELVETAVKEKDFALQREARAFEESAKLESRLNRVIEDYTIRLDKQVATARENLIVNRKKYVLEIKELKAELREKGSFLDRIQRENRLLEDELEKVRHSSENFLQRSSGNVLELEEKVKEAHFRIDTCEENCRRKYEEKIRHSEEKILDLETRLATLADRLRRNQLYSDKEFDERIREADERTKQVLERYAGLERRFARALDERENLSSEVRNLQTSYDREIARRENERRSQQTRISQLQDELKNNARASVLINQVENLQHEIDNKESSNVNINEMQASNGELLLRLKTLQDKFDNRSKELSQHVETHQKLCRRWKDEAESLTTKFQQRSNELKDKIYILRKENEQLNKELVLSRQQLAHCRVQVLNRYDKGDDGNT